MGIETYSAFAGLVEQPGSVVTLGVAFKAFPELLRTHGVFNEMLGHKLSERRSIPVEIGFPCACPVGYLGESNCVSGLSPANDCILGYAIEDRSPHSLKIPLVEDPVVWDELLSWHVLCELAVLDELMFAKGRDYRSLIRVGEGAIIVRDFHKGLIANGWDIQELRRKLKQPIYDNTFAQLIARSTDEVAHCRVARIARDVASNPVTRDELIDDEYGLLRLDDQKIDEVITMLNERAKYLPEIMTHYFEMGLLRAR